MKMYESNQSLEMYLNTELECSCGRTHYAPIKAVKIGSGALESLPELVKSSGYCKPCIVCDKITCSIAGERCSELLDSVGIKAKLHIISHLGFDEATLGELVVALPQDCDLVIAVGTGSITDIVRYLTYRLHLPCFTVATAAPMDGFAANIGIMNVNNLKATMQAHNTEVIIGDTDILKNAPYRMTVAGFGDLLGKTSCLNDWKLANIITGEHICNSIISLVQGCVDEVISECALIKKRDPQVLGKIMEGLVLSGTAISLYGDSRPASGAEHHMSHFWEAIMEQRGKCHAMHGEQVAVGTVLTLMLAEQLQQLEPDFAAAKAHAVEFDYSLWESTMEQVYGSAACEVIEIERNAHKNAPEIVLKRIDSMAQNWIAIKCQLASLPSSDSLRRILENIGCPSTPKDIGVDPQLLMDTILYCKEVRPRYTILQTAWDLGVLPQLAEQIVSSLSSEGAI